MYPGTIKNVQSSLSFTHEWMKAAKHFSTPVYLSCCDGPLQFSAKGGARANNVIMHIECPYILYIFVDVVIWQLLDMVTRIEEHITENLK